jgi:hypothetical protein
MICFTTKCKYFPKRRETQTKGKKAPTSQAQLKGTFIHIQYLNGGLGFPQGLRHCRIQFSIFNSTFHFLDATKLRILTSNMMGQ